MTAAPRAGLLLIAGSAWRATAFYTLFAVITTWPLALHLTSALPIDLGDSLLNCWILSWGADHVLALAHGQLDAFRGYWQAPIFHPSPLALAYSEHLFAQVLQIAPLYALTGNILLCYNVLFLSTFVLSGLGTYLLMRDVTGEPIAGWVAGLGYAFALYRLAQFPHLQVLSSQWLPFVFFGLRRFFLTRRARPLAGATAALCAQNLSCGYYLIFFAPFVALYCLYEILDRRLWRSDQVWAGLSIVAMVTSMVTWPFLKPYLELRALGFAPRSLQEVIGYSADVLGWLTAAPSNRIWGRLQLFWRAEGEVFPGLVMPLLALAGFGARADTLRRRTADFRATTAWRRVMPAVLIGVAIVTTAMILLVGATGDRVWRIAGVTVRIHDATRGWLLILTSLALAFSLSRRARAFVGGVPGSAFGFFALTAVASVWLSMGPVVTFAGTRTTLPSLYAPLYWHVPGFDGLRVPARYSMLAAFALAVLAGFGVRAMVSRGGRGRLALSVLVVAFLAESTSAPITINRRGESAGYTRAPDRMYVGSEVPTIYQAAASLPLGSSLIEFPFGAAAWDLQYMFYQRAHGKPIVNGYSGGFPDWYARVVTSLGHVKDQPEPAWEALRYSGASHAIVHRAAYRGTGADIMERWLLDHGATLVSLSGNDRLYALPPP